MIHYLNNVNKTAFITAVLLFSILSPYFLWKYEMSIGLFQPFICFLTSLIFLDNKKVMSTSDSKLFIFLLLLSITYWLTTGMSFMGFLFNCCSLTIPFAKDTFNKDVFRHFVDIYCAVLGISACVWIFVLIGVIQPIGYMDGLNNLKSTDYIIYPFVVTINSFQAFRFHGVFDEPGLVGTFSGILLYIVGFHKRNWRSYVLVLSGCLALSLFFYVLLFIYFAYNSTRRNKIVYPLIIVVALGVFYVTTRDNEIMSDRLWNRLEWNAEEGTIAGNNRVVDSQAKKYYEQHVGTLEYWLGDSDFNSHQQLFEGSSSYKVIVLRSGMIFFALYVSFFIIMAFVYNKKNKLPLCLYSLLIIVTLFQRPWMFGLVYFYLFTYYARYLDESTN